MFIHEAVKAAIEKNCFMKRETAWWAENIKLLPTNTQDCIVIYLGSNPPRRGWEPNAEDLMAGDWILSD